MNGSRILIVTVLLFTAPFISMAQQDVPRLSRPPDQLRVSLVVDGTDKIYVQGSSLWIVHETFVLPSNIKINGRKWDCQWTGNASDRYDQIDPVFKPLPGSDVDLRKTKGREGVQVIEKPTEANGFTACIQIADIASGADKYEFVLSWEK